MASTGEKRTAGGRAEGDTQTGKVGLEMPTERFIRLPDEKKKVILEAAMDEFSRVPFDKVSIKIDIRIVRKYPGAVFTRILKIKWMCFVIYFRIRNVSFRIFALRAWK